MLTALVLGLNSYTSDGTPYSGFSGGTTYAWGDKHIFALKLNLDDEHYSSVEFTVIGCGPVLPFPVGLPVKLFICNDDGSDPEQVFTGDLQTPQKEDSDQGPAWAYLCYDLKWRADQLTLLSSVGLGIASYNLAVTDPLYLFSQAGQSVGNIVTDVLQSTINAASLTGVGVGNYTIIGGVYTLPTQTLADLAVLTIVPPIPVQLQGESILTRLQSFIAAWQSQYTLYVQPDGTIRVISIFGRTAYTLTQPNGATGAGDEVDELAYNIDPRGCFGAVNIIGQSIQWAVGSFVDGTLVRATTNTQLANWTSASFNSPQNTANLNNAQDTGNLSGVTSVSCTVTSDNINAHWVTNFWNNNGGVIVLINTAVSGVNMMATVQITSCTALTAGGTAVITWSSSVALSTNAYTRYRMYAMNTPNSLVDRAWAWCEPATGDTGLATYIGSHMVPYSPYTFPWANQGKGAPSVAAINYPAAIVLWSPSGQPPYFSSSVPVAPDPTTGQLILSEPAVFISAGFANQIPALANGYPKTYFQGKPYDIQITFPYNAGNLNTRSPSSGFSGTAYTKYGIERVKTIALGSYVFAGDTAALNTLAQQLLVTLQDAVVDGSIRLHFDYWTPTFDLFTLGYALNIVTPGAASDIDGLNLPVRAVTFSWPNSGADIHLATFRFSNRHRIFEGDDLYIHPSLGPNGWGQDSVFVAGSANGFSGSVDPSEWNQAGTAQPTPPEGSQGASGESNFEGMPDIGAMSGQKISPEIAAMSGQNIIPEVARMSGQSISPQAAAASGQQISPQIQAMSGNLISPEIEAASGGPPAKSGKDSWLSKGAIAKRKADQRAADRKAGITSPDKHLPPLPSRNAGIAAAMNAINLIKNQNAPPAPPDEGLGRGQAPTTDRGDGGEIVEGGS